MNQASTDGQRDRQNWIFYSVAALQLLFVSYTFPVTELLSSKEHFTRDGGVHWYHMASAVERSYDGVISGYEPRFGAGVPAGVRNNLSTRLPTVLAVAAKGKLSEVQSWKLFSFLASLLGPLCLPLAVRLLRGDSLAIGFGAALGLTLWWASMFRWYHTAGMVSFVLASHLSLLFVCAVIRAMQDDVRLPRLALLGLAGSIGLFTHPLFSIPTAFGVASYLTLEARKRASWQPVLVATFVGLLCIAPNLVWIYPMYFVPLSVEPYRVTFQAVVSSEIVWKAALGIWENPAHGSKGYPLIAAAALWFIWRTRTRAGYLPARALGIAGVLLVAYAAFGAVIEALAIYTQPNRCAPVGYLFLGVPAAFGLAALFRLLFDSRPIEKHVLIRMMGLAAGLLLLINGNEVRREISYGTHGHYGVTPPEVRGLGESSRTLLSWLNGNTSLEGRILFETSLVRLHDNSHLAGYLALTTDREFIGGPYPYDHFADYWDETLFLKPIEELEPKRFADYADLYNAGWALVHSEASKSFFNGLSLAEKIREHGPFVLYKLHRNLSYVVVGAGEVTRRGRNELHLSELQGEEVVLAYHYVPGIRTTPFVAVEKAWRLDDPNPFIRLVNPPGALILHFP